MNIFERVAKVLKSEEESAFEANPVSGDFFEISHSTDTKIIGRKWPQTDFIELSVAHSFEYHEIQKKNLKFNEITLYPSSKLTDCISTAAISARGFLISERALEIFKKFNLGNHKIFPATIKHKEHSYSYYYLQIVNDMMTIVDYSRSSFYIADILGAPIRDIDINSAEEFKAIGQSVSDGDMDDIEEFSSLDLKKVVFNNNVKIPDFFSVSGCGVTMFITQRLYDKIREVNLTGFEISPTKRIVIDE